MHEVSDSIHPTIIPGPPARRRFVFPFWERLRRARALRHRYAQRALCTLEVVLLASLVAAALAVTSAVAVRPELNSPRPLRAAFTP